VGHHLHGGPVTAEHDDAHQFEAHGFERRGDDGGPPCSQAGVASVVRFMPLCLVQYKKGGPLRPPSVTQRRMIYPAQIAGRDALCKVIRRRPWAANVTGALAPYRGTAVTILATGLGLAWRGG